jgi:hypothetical protein
MGMSYGEWFLSGLGIQLLRVDLLFIPTLLHALPEFTIELLNKSHGVLPATFHV